MADTFGSGTYNGQMTPVLQGYAFIPNIAAGPSLRGSARPPATIPSGVGSNVGVSSGAGATVSGAGANPGSPARSPLPVLVGSLIVGLLILRYVHWRRA